VRALLTAVAVLAAGAGAACGGSADASAPSSPRRAVVIGGYWPTPGHRSVRVAVERTACSRDLRLTTLRQGHRAVRIAFDDRGVHANQPCPMLVRLECASVALKRPLGKRRLVDAGTGRRIGREGLRPPARCSHARRR
jgi:hypothetical protein